MIKIIKNARNVPDDVDSAGNVSPKSCKNKTDTTVGWSSVRSTFARSSSGAVQGRLSVPRVARLLLPTWPEHTGIACVLEDITSIMVCVRFECVDKDMTRAGGRHVGRCN
ncbi:hypothetical protein FOA52_010285 [Chlamydomonas sp. UWO 241]|nr:hypothetical protein FOA52_010285 [Chlamydomonas sp. UWO 241]